MTADVSSSAAPALEIRVLGPLAALRSGRPVRLGGLRQRAVLGRLIISAGRTVTTDQLAAAVWGESVPPGHVTTLQTYVFHLRAALEPDRPTGSAPTVLQTAPGGYRLDLEHVTLDATLFAELAASGRTHLAAGNALAAAAHLRAAAALWNGDVLADLRDLDFVRAYASGLTGLLTDVEEARLDAELALGENATVAAEVSALITAHPLRERFHAQRMLALYRAGRQSDALSVYTDLRRLLVDELGIEPNAQLQDLHRKILEQERRSRLGADPRAGGGAIGGDPADRARGGLRASRCAHPGGPSWLVAAAVIILAAAR